MAIGEIPEAAQRFIYRYVDSVELLEVLLLFHKDGKRAWNAQSLATELRSNANSIQKRILFLKSLGLLSETSASEYFYDPTNSDLHEAVTELVSAYSLQRHRVFELIFSPLKKARDFADAFRRGSGGKDGRDDG